MKTHTTLKQVMVALLVGIVTVPITTTALFLQQDSIESMNISADELRDTALEDRTRLRSQRRLYWRAIEQFQILKKQGEDAAKPDFNDPSTFDSSLKGAAPAQPTKQPAEEATVTSLTTDQLESHDRALLRRYTRAGFCPETLRDFYIVGFYELCTMLVGENVRSKPVTGLLNHNAYLYQMLRKSAPEQELDGFRLRLKMIDEAYNGTRRDGGVMPGRPTVCTMNPDCLTPRAGN